MDICLLNAHYGIGLVTFFAGLLASARPARGAVIAAAQEVWSHLSEMG